MLYGTHYHGETKPDSSIDLAFWMAGIDLPDRLAAFLMNRPRWQRELTALLGSTVHVELGDQPGVSVPNWIKAGGGVVVWQRGRR